AHHLRLGFPEVAGGLVGMGYRLAAGLSTAQEVGAPHRRERRFVLAPRQRDADGNPARLLTLADAEGGGQPQQPGPEGGPHGAGRPAPRRGDALRCSRALDDADGARPQGRRDESREHAGERPPWPPGPDDAAGWAEYLRGAPELEPAVRRGADGLAFRVDRL